MTHFDHCACTQFGHRFHHLASHNWMRWSEKIEYVNWYADGQGVRGRGRVRGQSWAHYLGPDMVRRLDAAGPFVEAFMAPRGEPLTLPFARRTPGGGAFVAITPEPMELLDPNTFDNNLDSAYVRHGSWLWTTLRKAGLV